jgi:hypothetical protein
VSKACAEHVLLPAVRAAAPDSVVLADGFSCRTQIHELDSGGREAVHLAELLDRARRGAAQPPAGDLAPGDRPAEPGVAARVGALAGVAAIGAAVVAVLARRR